MISPGRGKNNKHLKPPPSCTTDQLVSRILNHQQHHQNMAISRYGAANIKGLTKKSKMSKWRQKWLTKTKVIKE